MESIINQLKLASRIIALLIGAGILFAYAMFQGGFVSWFLFYSFVPFLLFSLVFAFYPLNNWKIERIIEDRRYETGDSVTVQIKLTRNKPFPLYFIFIEEKISDSINTSNQKLILYPIFKRKIKGSFAIDNLQRGEHLFNEIKITSADFFGWIRKEIVINVEDSITVYPKLQPIHLFSLKNKFGEGVIARGLDDQKESLIPTSAREYQPGDRLSWINWKMTANKNSPMTKEFDKTENEQIVIVMDRSSFIPSGSFEKIVEFTASLTNELYKNNIPIGLVSMGEEHTLFPVNGSNKSKQQIFYHLATVSNDATIGLCHLLKGNLPVLPPRSTIIFVVDQIQYDLLELAKNLVSNQYKIVITTVEKYGLDANESFVSKQSFIIKEMDDCFDTHRSRGEIE
ncbi:DUF58 domain-containing protein [Calidifontibacillus oryziterrae]|uniref:DUF58 domain-containing protein n=1 Tax=Calidifontibacillus oryziterrae TaxID=1191699 RepID=UPI00030F0CA3|nr:DUF58 domain-containing protein [Calidifontibacillus oryziterrae]